MSNRFGSRWVVIDLVVGVQGATNRNHERVRFSELGSFSVSRVFVRFIPEVAAII
jgi:hypothetical protein